MIKWTKLIAFSLLFFTTTVSAVGLNAVSVSKTTNWAAYYKRNIAKHIFPHNLQCELNIARIKMKEGLHDVRVPLHREPEVTQNMTQNISY